MASKSVHTCSGDIFYRESVPAEDHMAKGNVLLLHGMAFSSETWLNLRTLEKLAEWKYRAVAIDLPGYGNSKSVSLQGSEANFINEVCEKLSISSPVIISPSMSGGYSLPFLVEHGDKMRGYVPVAPVSTGNFRKQYPNIKVPTLIVYGDRDARLGTTSLNDLSLLPNSKPLKIENAGHACYLDQPDVWHSNLRGFLDGLTG